MTIFSWTTAGIAITQQAILRFVTPQRRHNSRISMKFGTDSPNFTLIREYLVVSGPKNTNNCQNFQLFCPAAANPLPDVDEIHKVYAGNRSTKATKIWCDSVSKLRIYRQKTAMGISPQKFLESPSSKTTGLIEIIKGVQKWYGHPLS